MDGDEDTTRLLDEFNRRMNDVTHDYRNRNLYTIPEYPTTLSDPTGPHEGEKKEDLLKQSLSGLIGEEKVTQIESHPFPESIIQPIRGEETALFIDPQVDRGSSFVCAVNATVKPEEITREEHGSTVADVALSNRPAPTEETIGDVNLAEVQSVLSTILSNLPVDQGLSMTQVQGDKEEDGHQEPENLIEPEDKFFPDYTRSIKPVQENVVDAVVEDVVGGFNQDFFQSLKETQKILEELNITEVQSEVPAEDVSSNALPTKQDVGTTEPENLIDLGPSSENAKVEPINKVSGGVDWRRALLDMGKSAGKWNLNEIEGSVVENTVELIKEQKVTEDANLNEIRVPMDNATPAVTHEKNLVEIPSSGIEKLTEPIKMEVVTGEKLLYENEDKIVEKVMEPIKTEGRTDWEILKETEDFRVETVSEPRNNEENLVAIQHSIVEKVIEPTKQEEITGEEILNETEASIVGGILEPIKDLEAKGNENSNTIQDPTVDDVIEPIKEEVNGNENALDIKENVPDPTKIEDITAAENSNEVEASVTDAVHEPIREWEITGEEKRNEIQASGAEKEIEPKQEEEVTGAGNLVGNEDSTTVEKANEEAAIGGETLKSEIEETCADVILQPTNQETSWQISEDDIDVTLHLGSYCPEEQINFDVTESEDEVEVFGISDHSFVYDGGINDILGSTGTGNLVFETCGSFLDIGRIPLLESIEEIQSFPVPPPMDYQQNVPRAFTAVESDEVIEELREVKFQTVPGPENVAAALPERIADLVFETCGSFLDIGRIPLLDSTEENAHSPDHTPLKYQQTVPLLFPAVGFGVMEELREVTFQTVPGLDNTAAALPQQISSFVSETCGSFLDIGRIPLLDSLEETTDSPDLTPAVDCQQTLPLLLPKVEVVEELREVTFQRVLGPVVAPPEMNWDDDSYFEKKEVAVGLDYSICQPHEQEKESSDSETSSFSFEEPEIPNIWDSLAAYGIVPEVADDDAPEGQVCDVPRPVTSVHLCDRDLVDDMYGLEDTDNANSEEHEDGDSDVYEGAEKDGGYASSSKLISSDSDDQFLDNCPVTVQEEAKPEPTKKETVHRGGALAEIRKLFTRVLINPLRRLFPKRS